MSEKIVHRWWLRLTDGLRAQQIVTMDEYLQSRFMEAV